MNWSLLILVFIFMLVFILLLASILLYIRHWASRKTEDNKFNDNEGQYFKRYIPEQLRPSYDKKISMIQNVRKDANRSLLARVASVVVVLTSVSIPVYSLSTSLHLFKQPIELSNDEIRKLDFTQHKWKRLIDSTLPDLTDILKKNRVTTFIVPYDDKDKDWLVNGTSLRTISLNHWKNFASKYKLNIKNRSWKSLANSKPVRTNEIILVLPGFWDIKTLDILLNNGANLLAYGPPAQLFSDSKRTEIKWHGLTFEESQIKQSAALILRGDQLLTLGIDAGLIVKAYTPLFGFRTTSDLPQAISIGNNNSAGGVNETRLYAKTIGKGRLVWMNFAPSEADNNPTINITHLNAIMGSIFRYFSRQSYSAVSMWPEARHFAALMEQDTEDKFSNSKDVYKLFKKNNYPITWFMLSNEVLNNRGLATKLSKSGELACHGDNHSDFSNSTSRDQVIRIARCQKVLTEITGIRPLAFRPPEEDYNSATIDAIINNGMTHYIANSKPDRAVPEVQLSLVNNKSLVSIPRMVSDDYEMWHTRKLNKTDSLALIDNEIDWTKQIGGLYMYSFHSQFMGNPDNLYAMKYMAEKIVQSNAYFSTSKNISDWWRFRTALQNDEPTSDDQFRRFKPVLMSVSKKGEFSLTPYLTNNE